MICAPMLAERILTQERIKLMELAMESYAVPPACYEVQTTGKIGQEGPPRWMSSRSKLNNHKDDFRSLQYTVHDQASKKLPTHDALVLTLGST